MAEKTLEQKIEILETENKSASETIKTLQKDLKESGDLLNKNSETIQGLEENLKESGDFLIKANDLYNELLKESSTQIESLSQELNSAKNDNANSIVTATHDGVKYRVLGKKFIIPGEGELTVDQILKNKPLLKSLIKQGVGFLVPTE